MNKSFMHEIYPQYSSRLSMRSDGFSTIFELLERKISSNRPLIIETGSLRQPGNWEGDGQSTYLFNLFAQYYNGIVYSVDIDPICSKNCTDLNLNNVISVTSDSIKFLSLLPNAEEIDLLYLDSYDLDFNNPEPSATHHLEELTQVFSYLTSGTVIAVDDNIIRDGIKIGKGYLVEEYLSKKNCILVYDGYQKVWVVK